VRESLATVALAPAVVVVGIPGVLRARGLTGQISGTVTDTTGGVLPGVTVAITNVGTGFARETVTGADGEFAYPDLLPGTLDRAISLYSLTQGGLL
jgi:hypothetical protein